MEFQLPYLTLDYSTDAVRAAAITHYVVPNIEKYAVVLSGSIVQPCVLWLLFCSSVLNCVIYTIIYYFRKKVLVLLRSGQAFSSTQNSYNVEQFVKALTRQSLVLTFAIFPPISGYLLIQFGILQPQVLGFFIAPGLCLGPVLDPIITMYYTSPYRLFIKSVIREWKLLIPLNKQQLQVQTLGTSAA
ncbi:unnamed protein product [Cylicocyclus nassatus]|uniref:Uncharacterized protein n=1 Tax=Cylicocyclus nassatus TaxID=53992 RepID=A0AA36MBY8_CYLNA|nr:unnamed protein product [Cylicocyclus nassatus]